MCRIVKDQHERSSQSGNEHKSTRGWEDIEMDLGNPRERGSL